VKSSSQSLLFILQYIPPQASIKKVIPDARNVDLETH